MYVCVCDRVWLWVCMFSVLHIVHTFDQCSAYTHPMRKRRRPWPLCPPANSSFHMRSRSLSTTTTTPRRWTQELALALSWMLLIFTRMLVVVIAVGVLVFIIPITILCSIVNYVYWPHDLWSPKPMRPRSHVSFCCRCRYCIVVVVVVVVML